jgi:hypothetical protein
LDGTTFDGIDNVVGEVRFVCHLDIFAPVVGKTPVTFGDTVEIGNVMMHNVDFSYSGDLRMWDVRFYIRGYKMDREKSRFKCGGEL